MSYAVRAARLHLVGWPLTLMWPWLILASSWVVNWVIFAALRSNDVDSGFTGGLLSVYICQFVVFTWLFTRGFRFAINLSVTRRAYYVGSWMVVLGVSLTNGIALTVFEAVEDATGGWGVDLPFFGVPFMVTGNVLTQTLVYAVPFVLFGGAAAVYGTVNARWGANGVFTAVLATVVLPGLVIALIAWRDWWVPIGEWFADASTAALFALWPGLAAVVCACGGFLLARRAAF